MKKGVSVCFKEDMHINIPLSTSALAFDLVLAYMANYTSVFLKKKNEQH